MDLIGLTAAVGGGLLAAILLFAVVSNKWRSAAERARTQGARRICMRL
jgi:hypothetical protein